MSDKYVLEGKTPKPIEDILEWARWFEIANRHVAKTDLPNNVSVSTVFLGLDHQFSGGSPILFETMIFGGKYDNYQERYSTWKEAEDGHKQAVTLANSS